MIIDVESIAPTTKYEVGNKIKFKLRNGEIFFGEIINLLFLGNKVEYYRVYVGDSEDDITTYLVLEHEIINQTDNNELEEEE